MISEIGLRVSKQAPIISNSVTSVFQGRSVSALMNNLPTTRMLEIALWIAFMSAMVIFCAAAIGVGRRVMSWAEKG